MKSRDIQMCKKLLLQERKRLTKKLEQAVLEDIKAGSNEAFDEADISSSTTDQTLTIRLLSRETRLLRKIEKALNKIESGSFGACEICGEEVGLKRLKVRLVADLCIICKENQEKKEINVHHSPEEDFF
jgi:DnaK suppressor protein